MHDAYMYIMCKIERDFDFCHMFGSSLDGKKKKRERDANEVHLYILDMKLVS